MPNVIVGLVGFVILFIILFSVLCDKNDLAAFILIIYFCSHYNYANNQGGLWNLLAFVLIIIYYLTVRKSKPIFKITIFEKYLIFILIVSNFLGYFVKGPLVPFQLQLFGAIAFLSYIVIFRITSNLYITTDLIRKFIIVTSIACFSIFIAAINQRFAIININTPLLGGYSAGTGGTITYEVDRVEGTFNHYELFGEYAMLLIIFSIPFLVSTITKAQIRITNFVIFIIIILSMFNILMTGTRAPFILIILGVILYFVFFNITKFSRAASLKKLVLYSTVTFSIIFLLGNFLGLKLLSSRLDNVLTENITIEGIVSGNDINRAAVFSMAINRIDTKSWYLGYGWGTPEANAYAWFGKSSIPNLGDDFHSLYLSLPMIYGWIGSIAFILLVFYIIFKLFIEIKKNKEIGNYILIFGVSLFFLLIFFLIDQFKISMLRIPNYQMLFWIWLGLANATWKTMQIQTYDNQKIV
ncbi:MAG: hypothetical protein STSR0008_14040 [Ignavibacterium sp.]